MIASEITNFNTKGLQYDTVVRCNTQEEADLLLEYLAFKGVWSESNIKILKKDGQNAGIKLVTTFRNLLGAASLIMPRAILPTI